MADSETDSSDDEEYFPDGEAHDSSSSCSDASDEEFKPVVRRSGRRASVDSKKRATTTRRRKRSITTRRKGGIKLQKEESDEEEEEQEEEEEEQKEEEDVEEEEKVIEDTSGKKEKARIDEIWAMFKNDVGNKSDSTLATPMTTTAVDTDKRVSSDSSKTVTITKKYDYAGEDVTVEEEVPKDSKEAQHYLQSQLTATTTTTGSDKECEEVATVTTSSPTSQEPKLGVKRLSGLSAVLSSINKRPKMSTLEKSKLDWTKFKAEEGLQDELSFHNKDGYLAKQEFLQRTEQREFERDRDERLKRMRRLH